jgi:hypothetical protein
MYLINLEIQLGSGLRWQISPWPFWDLIARLAVNTCMKLDCGFPAADDPTNASLMNY